MKRNEISYYNEIIHFIEQQLSSNMRAAGITDTYIFWKSGELKTKVKELIYDYPEQCACLETYSRIVSPLNLDIFAIINNGKSFEVVILEVKLRESVGLAEWSQLLGYNFVAYATYGLLINIDAGPSSRLASLLSINSDISKFVRITNNGDVIKHLFGFMQWNSVTHNFEYSNLGQIWSLSALSEKLIHKFSNSLQ